MMTEEKFNKLRKDLQKLGHGKKHSCITSSLMAQEVLGSDVYKFVAGESVYFNEDNGHFYLRDHDETDADYLKRSKYEFETKKKVPCHCWLEGNGLLLDFADGYMFQLKDVKRDISSWFRSREMNEGKPLYIPSEGLTELLYVQII